jgi:hypothetical protein
MVGSFCAGALAGAFEQGSAGAGARKKDFVEPTSGRIKLSRCFLVNCEKIGG